MESYSSGFISLRRSRPLLSSSLISGSGHLKSQRNGSKHIKRWLVGKNHPQTRGSSPLRRQMANTIIKQLWKKDQFPRWFCSVMAITIEELPVSVKLWFTCCSPQMWAMRLADPEAACNTVASKLARQKLYGSSGREVLVSNEVRLTLDAVFGFYATDNRWGGFIKGIGINLGLAVELLSLTWTSDYLCTLSVKSTHKLSAVWISSNQKSYEKEILCLKSQRSFYWVYTFEIIKQMSDFEIIMRL